MSRILGVLPSIVDKLQLVTQEPAKFVTNTQESKMRSHKYIYVEYLREKGEDEKESTAVKKPNAGTGSHEKDSLSIVDKQYRWKSNYFNQGLYVVGILSMIQSKSIQPGILQDKRVLTEISQQRIAYPRLLQGSSVIHLLEQRMEPSSLKDKGVGAGTEKSAFGYDFILDSKGLMLKSSFSSKKELRLEKETVSAEKTTVYVDSLRRKGIAIQPLLHSALHMVLLVTKLLIPKTQLLPQLKI